MTDTAISKKDERKQILEENTAQATFESFLESVAPKVRELSVTVPLQGTVNLGVLAQRGYNKLTSILFTKGGISELLHIPDQLEVLHCRDNLLVTLPNLPSELRELDATSNLLTKIHLQACHSLETLLLSHNELTVLENIPATIKSLKCDHNRLETLDVNHCKQLHTLHCQENMSLTLKEIPESVIHGHYPDKIIQSIIPLKDTLTPAYVAALGSYFSKKKDYELKLTEMREKKGKTIPRCMGCNQPVGMVFSGKDRKYQITCGGNPPCTSLNVLIHRGMYVPQDMELYTYYEDVEQKKQDIIQHKMATLFRHVPENKATDLFTQQMSAYNAANKRLEELLAEHKELYANESKADQIEALTLKMNEALERVKEARKRNDLQEAVEIQYREIRPASQAIQRLQYETMQLNIEDNDGNSDKIMYVLLQEEVRPERMVINLDETPTVA